MATLDDMRALLAEERAKGGGAEHDIDFKRVLEKPAIMFFGFVGCYGLMPVMALALARAFGLSPALTAGMVLVGSINGGQASNLCTYIAKGDVALSVLMTTVTTIGAIFMTPLLCKLILVRASAPACEHTACADPDAP